MMGWLVVTNPQKDPPFMAFHAFDAKRSSVANQISISIRRHSGTGKPRICIRIGSAVAQQVGWDRGHRVSILWGDDGDRGILRIAKADGAPFALRREGASAEAPLVVEAVVRAPFASRISHAADTTAWQRPPGEDVIDIRLPAWAFEPLVSEPPVGEVAKPAADEPSIPEPIAPIPQPGALPPFTPGVAYRVLPVGLSVDAHRCLVLLQQTAKFGAVDLTNHDIAARLGLPTALAAAALLGELQRAECVSVVRDVAGREIRIRRWPGQKENERVA